MVFSSLIFLFVFFPIVLLVYFLLPKVARNYWLFASSIFFYAWGEPKFVIVMLVSIVFNYTIAMLISRRPARSGGRRAWLVVGVAANVSLLFVYKYLNFTLSNLRAVFGEAVPLTHILLPIGISFFTFQALSYVVDVYRGNVNVQKNPIYVGLYIAFFPQLIAGPIVRYSTIEHEIDNRVITSDCFSEGVQRFLIGFAKKVLLANQFAVIADAAFSQSSLSPSLAWLGIISYSLQILFDFSGYSEMAIGLGRMFGFHFLENFNYPYISKSISEFWRRWHISLGTWFRDYVYFPLGGSRVDTKARLVLNLLIVWALTGVWHGANWTFLVWGLIQFLFIALEKCLPARKHKGFLSKAVSLLVTLLIVMLGWVFFRADSMSQAFAYIQTMFTPTGAADNSLTAFYLNEYWAFIIAGLLCATPVFRTLKSRISAVSPACAKAVKVAATVVHIVLFTIAVSYLVMGAYNPFIYFNF